MAAPRSGARRAALDGRGGADRARAGGARAGAAEPRLRRLPAAARRRDRRLGRRLAGHDRPRQPRGAVARDRAPAAAASPAASSSPLGSRSTRARCRPRALGRSGGRAVHPARGGRAGPRPRGRWAPGEPGTVPFVVGRTRAPRVAASELGEDEIVRLFARAGRSSQRCSPRPTGFAGRSAATRSPTSSRGTSSTRTSATSAAASAPSRRGSSPRTSAGRPYLVPIDEIVAPLARGLGARRNRGLPPGRDPPRLHGRLLRRRRRAVQGAARGCTSTRSPRSRCGRAPRRSGSPLATYLERLRASGSARCRARPPRSSTTRCARSSAPTR